MSSTDSNNNNNQNNTSDNSMNPPPATDTTATEATTNGATTQRLIDLVVNDEEFRNEFSAFAQDVVLQLRAGDALDVAVETALSEHEEIANHSHVQAMISMLPLINEKAQFILPFLRNIEPTEVPKMIEQFAKSLREAKSSGAGGNNNGCPLGAGAAMHPFIQMLLASQGGGAGLHMPWFGGSENAHEHGTASGQSAPFPFSFPFDASNGAGNPWNGGHAHGHGHGFGHHGGHHGFGRGGCGGSRRRGGHGGCGGYGRSGFGKTCGGKKGNCQSRLRAEIVSENVTLADKAVVLPQTTAVKTWRIRNSGEEAFPEGTKIVYVGRAFNALVDGVEFPVQPLGVGEEGEVSVVLSTPAESGRFGSGWRLKTGDGQPFGPMFRVRVVVATGEGNTSSSDSDDHETKGKGKGKGKKNPAKKLDKLLSRREKLEARLAKLNEKIESVAAEAKEMDVDDNDNDSGDNDSDDETTSCCDTRPIVSTLGDTPGNDEDNDNDDDAEIYDMVVPDPSVAATEMPHPSAPSAQVVVEQFAQQLTLLNEMGFGNVELNRMLLQQHNGQLDDVVNSLTGINA